MRQWRMMVGAAVAALGMMAGGAQAASGCARVCADDVRACVALAKAAHPCAGLQASEKKQCRADRHAARRSCRGLPAACSAGRKVCSGQ
jgi:hypothetical protein